MRNLFMILVAGILAVVGFSDYATATGTESRCAVPDNQSCEVNIDVVVVEGKATIVANPETLKIGEKDGKNRTSVVIHFRLTTDAYSFASNGINFGTSDRAKRQFSRDGGVGGPRHIVMIDKNTTETDENFKYSIALIPADGGDPIVLDPVIINGGGIN